ncbi:MAG TPA: TetR/AcrR family transcriptional regulator [Persephonella sp.]|uniref:Transcriptional regulator n=1 Tax=Persephonella marina (strain DSM 14350 / EX-H1) TaxID=123214 RepID=C0QPJ3_PERMH|nr:MULTISPECIES: TetR/AcrR family transcriptional regulator [Persephonella]ACO03984.1 transcriptional regulator [Persephonella marina EX-H1]HCB69796.1 TetR/AcrR family transcriptional regulator [Persephonella sp.]
MSQSDTKERLINSAVKIFSEKGYFNTKVSDIVKDAGVAQGTFYLYFKSKEEIFLSIVEYIVDQINGTIEKFISSDHNAETKVINFGREIFTVLYSYREIAYIYLFQLFSIDEKFKSIYVSTNNRIRDFYMETLKGYPQKEVAADILMGFGKRLLEFNILIQKQDINQVIGEFEKGVKIIFRGMR